MTYPEESRSNRTSPPGGPSFVKKTREVNELIAPRRRRIIELDSQIRSGKYPNCSSFVKYWLAKEGDRISTKTVQRDLDWLVSQRAPLEYDYGHKGYRYSDSHDWTLPFLDVTEAELVHVLLARQMTEAFRGTGLANSLATLFDRVSMLLPEKVAVDPLLLRKKVTFHPAPARQVSKEVWTSLIKALRTGVKIQIEYCSAWRNETRLHDVEPVHLACVEDDWYLIAWNAGIERMTHFAVPRIQKVILTEYPCDPRDFDADKYVSNRFGRWIGDSSEKTVKVVLRFSEGVAPYVKERPVHHKQTLKENRDGTVTVSFPAPAGSIKTTVKAYVLQWGGEVRVVLPIVLRTAVVSEAKRIVKPCNC